MIDFSEIYVMGLNADYDECVEQATWGKKVILHGIGENGKPFLDLVNFDENEANDFYKMINGTIGGGARLFKTTFNLGVM